MYMSVAELSRLIGLPEDVLIQLAAHGHIPGHKAGGCWRFWKSDIDKWLQAGRERLADDVGCPRRDRGRRNRSALR